MGGIFAPVVVKQGALASAGKKRTFLCYCRSLLFSQPFPGLGERGWWLILVTGCSGAFAQCGQNQCIAQWSCWGGERRASEKLSSQSNLRIASAEEGDLLYRVEQKGNREFVTGYVEEGAMTVSNPCVLRAARAGRVASSPRRLLCQAWALGSRSDTRTASLPVTASGTLSAQHAFSWGLGFLEGITHWAKQKTRKRGKKKNVLLQLFPTVGGRYKLLGFPCSL